MGTQYYNKSIFRSLTILALLLVFARLGYSQFGDTIVYWPIDTPNVSLEKISDKTFTYFTENTEWNKLETVNGVKGQALRLDGYSRYIKDYPTQSLPDETMYFSMWFALESYPVTCPENCNDEKNASLFEREGFTIAINRFGKLRADITVDGKNYFIANDSPLSIYTWHQIVFQINTQTDEARFYLDGNHIGTLLLTDATKIGWSNSTMIYMARSSNPEYFGDRPFSAINGLIDEVVIRDASLSDTDIESSFLALLPDSEPEIAFPQDRYADNPFRPNFHPAPMSGWTNEPHGFLYADSTYHFFYQKTSQPYKFFMNWGHMTSKDLVSWKDNPPVLWPEESYETKGIWSRHAVIDDKNKPTIFYTSVDYAEATISMATSDSIMMEWTKNESNPVVPNNTGVTAYRDPFIWKEEDEWKMMIGALNGTDGRVILYTSQDLTDWTYEGVMFYDPSGSIIAKGTWEMPVLLRYENKDVFLVNPVSSGQPVKLIYWVGKFANNKFTADHKEPKVLELFNTELAPNTIKDPHGRIIGLGILPSTGDHLNNDLEAHYNWGWANIFGLPKVMQLDTVANELCRQPLPELISLRGENFHAENVEVTESGGNFIDFTGSQVEIKARIKNIDAEKIGFILRSNPDGTEQTKLVFDLIDNEIIIDRTWSSQYTYAKRDKLTESYYISNDSIIDINLFVDNSVLDVFLYNRDAFATRLFPMKENSINYNIYVEGGSAIIESLDIWEMANQFDENITIDHIGEMPEFASIIRVNDITSINQVNSKNALKAYPVPFQNEFSIGVELDKKSSVSIQLFNSIGQQLTEKVFHNLASGKHTISVTDSLTDDLKQGIYITRVNINEETYIVKNIKYQLQ